MTIKDYIFTRYGTGATKLTIQLKKEKDKVATSKNQLIFLRRCISHKIIPKSFRIKSPLKNKRAMLINEKYRFDLLINAKNDAKKRFFKAVRDVKSIKEELLNTLSIQDMNIIENITEKSREKTFNEKKKQLIEKFLKLECDKNKNQRRLCSDVCSPVVKPAVLNLCGDILPKNQKDLLNLGPNFVPIYKQIPYMDIITAAESTALKMVYENSENDRKAQKLRQDTLRALKMSRLPKPNINYEQRQAIKELNSDKNISVYPFDKGTGFVRLPKALADQKIREQIGNTTIVNEDPTPKITRKVQTMLRELNKRGRFTKSEYQDLYPSDPLPPRMYGVVKAHKPEKDYPMRIIVSTLGTPTYKISEYLVKIIQPTLNMNKSRLKNSRSFTEIAKTWNITKDEVQVSYDVVNLYPSVPTQEATDIIINMLYHDENVRVRTKLTIPEIKSLIELCLSDCYFMWESEIHQLQNSGPIGLALMVVVAEAFLQHHEANALRLAAENNIEVKSFFRYVDDSHVRLKSNLNALQFLNILNNQSDHLKYTIEYENEIKSLNFLDINITNSLEGHYDFKIYRKPAITNVQIKNNSGHDRRILDGIFNGFVDRAHKICSKKFLDEEIKFLIEIFVQNGYNKDNLEKILQKYKTQSNIEKTNTVDQKIVSLPWVPGLSPKLRKVFKQAGFKAVFKSGNNLKNILTRKNKSKLPPNSHSGVYKLDCSCKKSYIGETGCKISTRVQQHQKSIEDGKWERTGLSEHAKSCHGHINWNEIKTLSTENSKFKRKVREALEIQHFESGPKFKNGVNQDDGNYVTTSFWKPIMKHIRKSVN